MGRTRLKSRPTRAKRNVQDLHFHLREVRQGQIQDIPTHARTNETHERRESHLHIPSKSIRPDKPFHTRLFFLLRMRIYIDAFFL